MDTIELTIHFDTHNTICSKDAIISANDHIGKDDERWRTLWREPMQSEHLSAIDAVVASLQPCKNILVLGIGGSALGTKALYQALKENATKNVYVLDNIDPNTFQNTIKKLTDSSETVVVVVSKSGGTAEIGALLMATQNALPSARYVAICGKSGDLRSYATENGWEVLPVPDGVGGRFSVLSPVGLFPIALCGIEIEPLLDGARQMDDLCKQLQNNPAGDLATALISAMQDGFNIQVMMPYCDRLVQLSEWYVQLWAESLGKVNSDKVRVGPSPMTALGATDQHSMLQLWREGPTDKVIGFVEVTDEIDVSLGDQPISTSLSWLCGKSLGTLLHAQKVATEEAVRDAGQKTWTLTMPSLNAHSIGQFIALWQNAVAIAGRIMKINPYDQPGVELGKELTKRALTQDKSTPS
ncbi:MAG: glucose-6-phosphate isomerase [Phycisphaerae bacterium]|jgi:glucose-6-phosphate isomerase|nr:glucose-6-phosphate isomerase [Phycisphaerae bacterium]